MAPTHDYDTARVVGSALTPDHVLVGESGGLSAVYEVEPSNIAPGMLVVITEHGPLYLDPNEKYDALAERCDECGQPIPPTPDYFNTHHDTSCSRHPAAIVDDSPATTHGDPYVILDGGLVTNDPALPVFDLDVLNTDFPDRDTAAEVANLLDRAAHAGLDWIVDRCVTWQANHPHLT